MGHCIHKPTISRTKRSAFLAALLLVTMLIGTGCALAGSAQRLSAQRAADATAVTAPAPAVQPPAPTALPVGNSLPSIAEVSAAVRPAVVFIATTDLELDFFMRPGQQEGVGSGVLLDSSGHIITNSHVVRGAGNIQVTLPDGRTFENAKVVGSDRPTDLAVLKIEGPNLPVARLGNSDELSVGDWVVAIGNALGLTGGPTVTAGVVGATGRSIRESRGSRLDDLIQTDAAINPGNSGGPLINMAGEVVGINTAIDTRGQGIGFAISINSARPIIEELIQKGRVVRAYIGVNVGTMSPVIANQLGIPPVEGAFISALVENGPADKAGLRVQDVIVSLDGNPISGVPTLIAAIRDHQPGEQVDVGYLRDGQQQQVTVLLEELPSDG